MSCNNSSSSSDTTTTNTTSTTISLEKQAEAMNVDLNYLKNLKTIAATGIRLENYDTQLEQWPNSGKVVMCQQSDQYVIVYQAFNDGIGKYAAKHNKFKGALGWQERRMTWFKTDFLWMMYRSKWAASKNQTTILAIKVKKAEFEKILLQAVPSSFSQSYHTSKKHFQKALKSSDIRLQWDPSHLPDGKPFKARRAVQIGLRNKHAIEWASGSQFVSIEDITEFVVANRTTRLIPLERPYVLSDELQRVLGVHVRRAEKHTDDSASDDENQTAQLSSSQ
mmetsp:Transcript_20196/g.34498  ORF Transcript_20196/g.34498 Transcript_20196/m.34498 type:complete len:279 (+) Transcript_20196:25-861(+)